MGTENGTRATERIAAALGVTKDELKKMIFDAITKVAEASEWRSVGRPAQGCICPSGANETCQAPLCPRQNKFISTGASPR